MATIQELRKERLRKLDELKKLGVDPYPAHTKRTHTLGEIKDKFAELEHQPAKVVGRIIAIRKFGSLAFIVIKDFTGEIQLFVTGDALEALDAKESQLGMNELSLLDAGDFLAAEGEVIKTETGEISIKVKKLKLLSKSLRPLPLNREGFTNKEERLRRRYVDMNVNSEVRDRFIRRSEFWRYSREFLNKRGFSEINIPVLEHTTGGADAKPFVTHMDALDQDFYLRISHELPLKRLIGAGFEKVYDIGPRFRNENYSDEHLPEHVALEWYWAYADWNDGIELQTEMFRHVIGQTFKTLKFQLNGLEVDLEKDWQKIDYAEVIASSYDGLDVYNCTIEQVKEQLKKHSLEIEQTENKPRGIDKLWKNIRKDIAGPAWLLAPPEFISPLAKAIPGHPESTQRFQAIAGGSEICNGFSELNDPIDQYNRFLEQQKMRNSGDKEAMMMDIDYIEMLEYGMPPTCGLGYSERAFWLFEGVTAREGVPFPQLKKETDATSREIYPEAGL